MASRTFRSRLAATPSVTLPSPNSSQTSPFYCKHDATHPSLTRTFGYPSPQSQAIHADHPGFRLSPTGNACCQREPRGPFTERLGSIPRDGLVHGGVGVEAAFQVEDFLEADPLEGHGHVGAAVAVVADHDGLGR